MKTRDTRWFDEQYAELKSQGKSWGTAEMYQNKTECLQWCCQSQGIRRTASILDLGCGAGELAAALADAGYPHVDGVDISAVAIDSGKLIAPGRFRVLDFAAPCQLEQAYDCIFDTDCFQMVVREDRRRTFLSNVAAHLTTHGVFLTGINSTKEAVDPHICVDAHVQYFWPSKEDYVTEVQKAGFILAEHRDLPPRNKAKCDRWSELIFRPTGEQPDGAITQETARSAAP